MSIDRVATNTQTQFLLSQISTANANLTQTQDQVSSGNVANDYAGYGDKTAAMEAARSAANRASAYHDAAQAAMNQSDLQDTQLNQLSNLATQLRQALTTAAGNNDGSSLMSQVQGIFDQAVQVLNSTDSNGNYLFGGDKNTTPPVTATTLSALAAAPSAASVFANGSIASSVNVADGQSVKVGVLASDAGTQLLQTIQDIAQLNSGPNGPIAGTLTGAQSTALSSEIATAATAATTVNNVLAANGDTYQQLKSAVDHQSSMTDLYKTFTSNIQDVDMAQAITNLNQDQTALQATLQVTAGLNKLSLLNYMGTSATG